MLFRKSSTILKLKEEKLAKDQLSPLSPTRPSSRAGATVFTTDKKEKDELKAIIRKLEDKLKGKLTKTQ